MFNLIRKTFTGYKLKKITDGALSVKVSYKGKLSNLDPLAPLKVLKVKINQTPENIVDTSDFNDCWETRTKSINQLAPSYVAEFTSKNSHYKISRYTSKENKTPLSIYTFSEGDKLFGVFTRTYDYGAFSQKKLNSLTDKFHIEKNDGNSLYISSKEHSLFVDQFGHSRTFIWKDSEVLKDCLKALD